MTWDPYGMPNAPSQPRPQRDSRMPEAQPPRVGTILAVLCAMLLLAVAFTVAAQAQDTTDTSKQQQTEATAEQPAQAAEQPAQAAEEQQQAASDAATQKAPDEQTEAAEAPPTPLDGQVVEQPEGSYLASDMIGRSVMSAEGEEMGRVSDLLVTGDDEVVGVLIGVGGFLGFGEKLIAVNIHQLNRTITEDGSEQLALNYTRAQLEEAPAFLSLAEQQRQAEAEAARKEQEQQQQEMLQQQSGGGTGQQPGQAQTN